MSDSKHPSDRPGGSGEHPAVREMRAKFESYDEHQLAELRALAERTRALSEKPIPRRDGSSDPPVDIVVIPPDSQTITPIVTRRKDDDEDSDPKP